MAEVRLLLGAASYLVVGTLWAYVGLRVLRRSRAGQGGRATRRFAAWWLGLAGHSLAALVLALAVAAGRASALLVAAVTYAASVFIAVMFWGLVSYLLYLYAGRAGVFPAVTFAYAVQLSTLVAVLWWLHPIGAHVSGWTPIIDYARAAGAYANGFVTLTFLVPPVACGVAYLLLVRRVEDRTSRYRIALVSGSILGWLVGNVAIGAVPASSDAAAVASRLLGVLAALAVLLAYEPPAWLQRRLRIQRLGHEVLAPQPTPAELAQRKRALSARVRDLV